MKNFIIQVPFTMANLFFMSHYQDEIIFEYWLAGKAKVAS